MDEKEEKVFGTLDATTLKLLRDVYKTNAPIEAISVLGIPEGKTGRVKRVLQNGNIAVTWDTGEEAIIRYGKESIRVIGRGNCLLEKKEEYYGGCDGAFCDECGWNRKVYEERMTRVRNGELSTGKDGARKLIVKKPRRAL